MISRRIWPPASARAGAPADGGPTTGVGRAAAVTGDGAVGCGRTGGDSTAACRVCAAGVGTESAEGCRVCAGTGSTAVCRAWAGTDSGGLCRGSAGTDSAGVCRAWAGTDWAGACRAGTPGAGTAGAGTGMDCFSAGVFTGDDGLGAVGTTGGATGTVGDVSG